MNWSIGMSYIFSFVGAGIFMELIKTKLNKISTIITDSIAIFLIIINLLVFHIIYLKHIK